MAYKPTIKSSYERGTLGSAKVQVSGDGKKVRVVFDDENKEPIVLLRSNCPKNLHKGHVYVAFDKENKKMENCRPLDGVFNGKVVKFPSRENEEPSPKSRSYTFEGKSITYQYFTVMIGIVKGDWRGTQVPFMPRYHFTFNMEDSKKVVAIDHPKSKYTPILMEFLDVAGVWEKGAIPYRDNLLPSLAKRINHENKEFGFVMKDGYITNFFELDDAPVLESENASDGDEPF